MTCSQISTYERHRGDSSPSPQSYMSHRAALLSFHFLSLAAFLRGEVESVSSLYEVERERGGVATLATSASLDEADRPSLSILFVIPDNAALHFSRVFSLVRGFHIYYSTHLQLSTAANFTRTKFF